MNLLQIAVNLPVSSNFDILQALWNLSPILALLAAICVFLVWRNEKLNSHLFDPEKGILATKDKQIAELTKTKEDQLKELNEYIRENDKENLEVLSSLNNTMDKLIQSILTGNDTLKEKIVVEATGIKTHIDVKIAELKSKS